MAISTKVYLKCDSNRCQKKISFDLIVGGDRLGEEYIASELRREALDSNWWQLNNEQMRMDGESLLFHSQKCIRDYLLDQRKMEIAAANKKKQADEIEEAIIISQGDQLEMGESDAQDALGGE